MKKINLSPRSKKIVTVFAVIVLPSILVGGFLIGKKIYDKAKAKNTINEAETDTDLNKTE